ncbi:MAG: BACON domain-containing protein [Candidatus Hydrogenedentes bacterium]|nr:BACON domain-containing protein [Candidatus Hydrogenedentota bacterium]
MIRRLFACIALAVLLAAGFGTALAEPALVLANTDTYRGGTASLRLRLENGDQSYAGVNAKIRVPQGATVLNAVRGALLPGDFSVDTYVFNDGTSDVVGVLAYSGTGVTSTNSGVLAVVNLAIDLAAPLGQQSVQFSGAVTGLSNNDGSESVAHTVSNGILTITAEAIPNLKVTPKKRYVPYSAGQVTFNVKNNGTGSMSWSAKVRKGKDWASISGPANGSNTGSFTVSFGPNLGVSQRTAVIRVTAPNAPNSPVKVRIVQGTQSTGLKSVDGSSSKSLKALLDELRKKLAAALVDGGAATTFAPLLPGRPNSEGIYSLRRDGSIFLRVRSEEPVIPGTVQVDLLREIDGEGQTLWLGTEEGDLTDGWIVYTPDTSWIPGEQVALTGTVQTASGSLLETSSYTFEAESLAASTARALTPGSGDPAKPVEANDVRALAGGVGPVYRVAEDQAFETPQRVWLPVPEGFSGSDLAVFYYQPTGDAVGWYPAENVEGWLVPESVTLDTVDGLSYIGLEIRHGATLQLGVPLEAVGASIAPLHMSGIALVLCAFLPVLLWALRRMRRTTAQVDAGHGVQ